MVLAGFAALVGLVALLVRPRPSLTIRWSARAPRPEPALLAAHGPSLYTVWRSGRVECLQVTSGVPRWPAPLRLPFPTYCPPTATAEALFVATDAGEVFARASADGEPLWSVILEPGAPVRAPPVVIDGQVFVGTDAGDLWVLDVQTGETLARHTVDGAIAASPAVTPERVYVPSTEGSLHVLRRRAMLNGRSDDIEAARLKTGGGIYTPPLAAGHWVCVGSDDGGVYCLRESADPAWRARTYLGGPIRSPLASDGENVYWADEHRWVRAVRLPPPQSVIGTASMVLTDRWRVRARKAVAAGPFLGDGWVAYATGGGEIALRSAANGELLYRYETGWPIAGGLLTPRQDLIVSDREGRIFVVGLPAGAAAQ